LGKDKRSEAFHRRRVEYLHQVEKIDAASAGADVRIPETGGAKND
jgi:hypothetical protein